jgi:AGZA family xanthine/uracil permease-like MFS transporter
MFVDVFDTVGTMIPIIGKIKEVDKDVEKVEKKILGVDAAGTMLGAALGTTTVTAYIESLSGVEEGGRTGLTTIVTGILFLLAVFIAPITILFSTSVTSIALIYVGALMFSNVKNID